MVPQGRQKARSRNSCPDFEPLPLSTSRLYTLVLDVGGAHQGACTNHALANLVLHPALYIVLKS